MLGRIPLHPREIQPQLQQPPGLGVDDAVMVTEVLPHGGHHNPITAAQHTDLRLARFDLELAHRHGDTPVESGTPPAPR